MALLSQRWNLNKILWHFFADEEIERIDSLHILAFKACLNNMYIYFPLVEEIFLPPRLITRPNYLEFVITLYEIFQKSPAPKPALLWLNNNPESQLKSSYLFLKKYDEKFRYYYLHRHNCIEDFGSPPNDCGKCNEFLYCICHCMSSIFKCLSLLLIQDI